MQRRMLICDIDSISRLLQDYCGQIGFPDDAKPVKLMFHKADQKLALVVESDEFTTPQAPEQVKFDIKRIHGLGGVN